MEVGCLPFPVGHDAHMWWCFLSELCWNTTQRIREAVWCHHALVKVVESRRFHLVGFPMINIFGKTQFCSPWQNTLLPPNSMGTSTCPLDHPLHTLVRAKSLYPCTGNSSSARCPCLFLTLSDDSGYIVHVTDTQLVNVSLWGFGKNSELFRSLPVSSWDSASLPCYSQGAGESHKSSTALLSASCILSPSTSLLIVITF